MFPFQHDNPTNGLMVTKYCLHLPSSNLESKANETMGLVPNLEFMRINTKSPKVS